MPFALIVLSGDASGPAFVGPLAAALAFLMVGAGIHMTQTAGLALASDLAEPDRRHRVVALLYVMLLVGTCLASIGCAHLLSEFSQIRLIQVVQGAAALTMALNLLALWKQEPRRPQATRPDLQHPLFSQTWRELRSDRRCTRLLTVSALGAAGLSMQDVLLEPAAGELLHLSVAGTTMLNALVAAGTLLGFATAARGLDRRHDPMRIAAAGLLIGIAAFCAITFAVALLYSDLFRLGAFLIGVASGLFAVGTLTTAMMLVRDGLGGRVLGAWGAAHATASGIAIAVSGPVRDVISTLSTEQVFGPAMTAPASGYLVVFHIEIAMLFLALGVIGPLVGRVNHAGHTTSSTFGLAEHPG
jgi:BCD family chlorophyll transporter-like MFS transporter